MKHFDDFDDFCTKLHLDMVKNVPSGFLKKISFSRFWPNMAENLCQRQRGVDVEGCFSHGCCFRSGDWIGGQYG